MIILERVRRQVRPRFRLLEIARPLAAVQVQVAMGCAAGTGAPNFRGKWVVAVGEKHRRRRMKVKQLELAVYDRHKDRGLMIYLGARIQLYPKHLCRV